MQRYIPFGYRIENGSTVINDEESAAVKTAFEMYIGGASYKTIAEYMESTGVNYRQDSSTWNKNMVKRILENERYTGIGDYPDIIDRAMYEQVVNIIATKGGIQGKPHPLDKVKGMIVCAKCGCEYIRRDKGKRSSTKWKCKNDSCDTMTRFTDSELETQIIEKLNNLIADSTQIRAVTDTKEPDLGVKRINNEINREFDRREIDKNRVTNLLLELAGEKYKSCDDGSSERHTEELRRLFSRQKPITKFHGGLFFQTVRRLHIHQDGDIRLELINNQII